MASNKYQLARFRIIDKELQRKALVKTNELVTVINSTLDINVSKRTVQDDINLMRNDSTLAYYAPIEYDQKTKAWMYTDRSFSINAFQLKEEELKSLTFYSNMLGVYKETGIFNYFSNAIEKVLDAMKIQASSKNDGQMDSVIQIEQQAPYSGSEFIPQIMTALQEQRKVAFAYQKFVDTHPKKIVFSPYLLKSFQNRWYLLGFIDGKDLITTYSLDRIQELQLTEAYFTKKNIDFAAYYKDAFGITVMDEDAVEVILSFTPLQGKYIKTLPLHDSQKILIDNEEELRVALCIKPAFEFYAKILSFGTAVKVLSPDSVAEKVKEQLRAALKRYE